MPRKTIPVKNCAYCNGPMQRWAWERPFEYGARTHCSRLCALKARAIPVKAKLEAHKRVTPSGCWEWTGHRDPKGYGRSSASHTKEVLVHRLSYIEHIGPIPADLHVCHRCDNPPCFNPAHLYAGTNDDNVKDRHERNRWGDFKGVRNPRAKITEADVRDIRESSENQEELAHQYGVSQSTISAIRRWATWKHVA